MNEIRRGETNSVVLAGMCTALAVVLSVAGFYLPLVSSIIFLLIPLPIAYLGMKEGASWAVIVLFGVMVLDSLFFGIISAAFLCAIFGMLGVVMGICYRHRVSAQVTLIVGAVVVLAALVGEALAAFYVLNMPQVLFGGEMIDRMESQMLAQMGSMYTGELLVQAEANVHAMMDVIRKSIPFAAVAAAMFYSWASMTLGKKVFRRLGITDIPVLPPLERWEFSRLFVGLYILVVLSSYFIKDNEMVSLLSYNGGLICTFVFWLQGLAVLWWFPRKYPVMKPFRWVVAVLSAFVGYVQLFVVLMGMADLLLRYRKKRNYE